MSGMADEIAARMEQDGAGSEAPAPGNERETPNQPAEPSAGTSNTDNAQGATPETVPYARFKEVNDQLASLKGYATLNEYGYDPDSLGQLAAFEARFMADPIGTYRELGNRIDLPDEVKAALEILDTSPDDRGQNQGGGDGGSSSDGADDEQPPPSWAKELLDDKRQREEEARTYAQQEEEEALDAQLDSVLDHWRSLDKADKLTDEEGNSTTPEHLMLTHISAAAARGGYTSTEALAEAARKDLMDYRESVLEGTVQRGRRDGAPALSGGSALPSDPLDFGSDIRKASKAAVAALERGELPTEG